MAVAAALASLSSAQSFDCTADISPNDEATCDVNPWFAEIVNTTGNNKYEAVEVVTADKYILNMFRFIGGPDGDPIPGQGTRGPVLLHHGEAGDSTSWFNGIEDAPQVPSTLFEQGWDVYLSNRRGTYASRTHETLDPDTDAAQYWDFSQDEVGKEDIPAMVSAILKHRLEEGLDCKKVQLLTFSVGGQEALITMSEFPDSSQAYIDRVVTEATCAVSNVPALPEEAEHEEGEDDGGDEGHSHDGYDHHYHRRLSEGKWGRMLEHWDPYYDYMSCNKTQYYHAMNYWRYQLTHHQYVEFYNEFVMWKQEFGSKWHCNNAWIEGLQQSLCKVGQFLDVCAPEPFSTFANIFDTLKENEIYSINGPNWETQISDLCEKVGEDDIVCQYLRARDDGQTVYNEGGKEMSVKQFYHMMQQGTSRQFDKFNPDWGTNGWFTDVMEYDVTKITTPLYTNLLQGDLICDTHVNGSIEASVPTQKSLHAFQDSREDHYPFQSAIDEDALDIIIATLARVPDDADCAADATFPWVVATDDADADADDETHPHDD